MSFADMLQPEPEHYFECGDGEWCDVPLDGWVYHYDPENPKWVFQLRRETEAEQESRRSKLAKANRPKAPAEPAEPERTALYRFFNESRELLYVGITNFPEVRWQAHAARKPWWSEVTSKEIAWHETRSEALAAERKAIATEAPRYNIQGVPKGKRHALD